jgi:5-oxoprolinase (ATP-hydrolysing)
MTFHFSIDRGGTFTDVYAEWGDSDGRLHQKALKLLSVDPSNYPDAPREGIRRILESETGQPHPRDLPLDTSNISSMRMGTTVRGISVVMNSCTPHRLRNSSTAPPPRQSLTYS